MDVVVFYFSEGGVEELELEVMVLVGDVGGVLLEECLMLRVGKWWGGVDGFVFE